MNDGLRRSIIVALVFGISLATLFAMRGGKSSYGLFQLFSDDRAQPTRAEKFTLATDSRLLPDEVPGLSRLNMESRMLMEAVKPSVVSINTATEVNVPTLFGSSIYNRRVLQPGLGSGVIVTEEGHIVTNYHVIQQAQQIQVTLEDDRKFPVRVVGADAQVDIAVLQIIADDENEIFPALHLADSDKVQEGEIVFAVGNPFGLSGTVTQGIISHRERRFRDNGADLFQTDTVINPGNSGGPLININGDVIGINVAVFSGQKHTGLWQGVGLAIASNDVHDALDAILKRGKPIYGYLGVQVYEPQSVSDNGQYPVIVAGVEPDSPAAKAGLQNGDKIIKFSNNKIANFAELKKRVRRLLGETVDMLVERGDEKLTLPVLIEEYDEKAAMARAMKKQEEFADATSYLRQSLGLEVRDLTPEEKQNIGVAPDEGGVLVTDVIRNSPSEGELLPGDLIHHCNTKSFGSSRQFAALIGSRPENEDVILYISRRPNKNINYWQNALVLIQPLSVR
jgi:serine protease Do